MLLILFYVVFLISVARVPETTWSAPETPAAAGGTIPISPGSDIQRELGPGASDGFVIPLDEGKLLRFTVDKGDLVLMTALYGPTGAKLVEHVSQDFESVQIVFPTQVAGTYRLELKSLEKDPIQRRYELKLQPLTNVTTLNQKDSEARQALARADRLCANWTESSVREAIPQYDRAAVIWTSISDFASASDAILKSAEVYFRLSEYPESLKRYQNAVALAEKAGNWLAKARALSRGARVQSYLGHNDLAETQLKESMHLFKGHEADRDVFVTNAYGETISNLGEVSYAKGDFLKASKQFEEALKIFSNDRKREAKVHLFLGYIAGGAGELEKALIEISRAHELYLATNNKVGEGLALIALGLWHSSQDVEKAISLHKEALEIFRLIGERHSEAIALTAIGQGYETLDEQQLALNSYEQALHRYEDISAADGISTSSFKIARMHDKAERFEQALSYYDRCVRVSRAARKIRTEGFALNEIATIYVKQGFPERAAAQYQKILRFFESIGDLRGQATALNSYGDLLLQRDEKKALDLYLRALPLSEKVGDEDIRTATLYNLARTNLKLGFADIALSFIERSLNNIEDLRSTLRSPEFRATYFSGVQKHYKLCIDILAQLDKMRPGQGFATKAFIVSEKNRSRVLLDLVHESRANIREGAAKELLDRERRLRGLIQLQAQYRMDLMMKGKDSNEIADVESQLTQLRADYQAVEAQLRQHNPRLLSLEQSTQLSLDQVQSELKNGDAMLLEYSLGEERSYLWAITSNSFQTYELPGRKIIEDHARECYRLLTARQGSINPAQVEVADKQDLEVRSKLGEILLGPVAGQLGNKNLLVVSEGALQYVPLSALLVPNTTGDNTLLETNDVVVLPSVSTLIAMRSAHNHASSTNKLVAVIADPVFSAVDDRVQHGANDPAVAQAATDKGQTLPKTPAILMRDGSLQRLVHASEEADAISSIAPWGSTMVARGFDASRETAMNSDIGQYQIVHFATHGFLNSEHPELSGIVLTMVDRNGVSINGLMPLHDIYNLELSSELTVLSACQTALGKEIKGEGIVGLTHGFMAAGSKSVVASLWKVDDRATAALMAEFYEGLLNKGMTPVAALRAAKLKMMRDQQWSAPYYWAGFVLQGEYANQIVVDRHPWLRPRYLIPFFLILIAAGLIVFLKRKQRLPHLR